MPANVSNPTTNILRPVYITVKVELIIIIIIIIIIIPLFTLNNIYSTNVSGAEQIPETNNSN